MNRRPTDLAEITHWNAVYRSSRGPESGEAWSPTSYVDLTLEWALSREIERAGPGSIFEVGCGNSTWLPYLAKKYGVSVAGLDYSAEGCRLAQERLDLEEIDGRIFCRDLFEENSDLGQYDFVYSLGVVEHFDDLELVMGALLKLVKDGGHLFTEVPNLASIHGLLCWIWQPELFAKHRVIGRSRLRRAYVSRGLSAIDDFYAGVFGLQIVAWRLFPRWPRLARRLLPRILRLAHRVDEGLKRRNRYQGYPILAPYVVVSGRK